MERVNQIVHTAYAHAHGYLGQKIGIAVLDTGVFLHPDLREQVRVFRDFCYQRKKIYDDNGHGTHVAGIIAGSGASSDGRYMGIAPESHLICLKVLDFRGNGSTGVVVSGIRWCIEHQKEYQIRIMNISVGMLPNAGKLERQQLLQTVEEAWNSGIVVVVAAGNNGPKKNSVTIPGICPSVITVGSSDDWDISQNSRLPNFYSGCGPTDNCVQKPEILAPGTGVISCSASPKKYERRSGTSMATPVVSGCIALLLSKYPHLKPAEVKLRLYEHGIRMALPQQKQGWGRIDLRELL
ncbi:MAG: S8 family peptidase [Lachnospiraceae bacterium]